ncbi:MAG: S-adenosylmethionine decarboxylase proenzyme [Calditrichaeota bacterium]|nr:S-adenosylmethionine decarboxylase proenzyme [Calditrichota bacterium]HQU72273.1 adenosylmethionine decarboxylase [Calditrichia bacterium]
MKALGRHILAEFFDCDNDILDDTEKIELIMKRAAIECGATIISSTFHEFNPHGVSGVVVIAESHLAIHTWPEYGYAAVDVFTCGETVDPAVAKTVIQEHLDAQDAKMVQINRGELKTNRVLHHKPVMADS